MGRQGLQDCHAASLYTGNTGHGKSSTENQKPRAWTEPRHAAFEVSRRIYGYGSDLLRSCRKLNPFPGEPVDSNPSPPNIANTLFPSCAGVVVQEAGPQRVPRVF